MKVLDIAEIKLERIDLNTLTQHAWTEYEIPDGHIGAATIIREIAKTVGKFSYDDDVEQKKVKSMSLRALIGMGWEAMVYQLYPNVWWQPGVMTRDGVCGHPDAFGEVYVPQAEPCVREAKYTARSLRVKGGKDDEYKDIKDEWMWQCQMMAYLKLHPAEPVHGIFDVCWAMGNYTKYTLDERYMRYLVEYTRDEIDRNWKMIVQHREQVMRAII